MVAVRIFIEPHRGADYPAQLRLARHAEECGFAALLRADHYQHMGSGSGQPGPTDAWVTLGALARETSRIRLGTLVTSMTFRLPGPLAITVAQVDQMSDGRVELGIGAGWFAREHTSYGIPFPPTGERLARLAEQLDVITGLWRSPDGAPFSYHGTYYQLLDAPGLPKPTQRPTPPIIVGGRGTRRTPEIAARFADEFNAAFQSVAAAGRQFRLVQEASERVGRTAGGHRRPPLLSGGAPIAIGRTDAEARRRAEQIYGPGGQLPHEDPVVGSPAVLVDRIGRFAEVGTGEVEDEDLTVVAAVHQQTVFSIIALEGSGITSPADLEGRTVGDAAGSFGATLFPAYAELSGIDPDAVDYDNSFDPPQLPNLLATDSVDAIGQYLVGQPTIEQVADGRSAVVLPFSEVLPDLYGISLFTSADLAEEDPELVEGFVRALMRGLDDAMNDPEEAASVLVEHEPEMDVEAATSELELMAPYVQPDDGPLGMVEEDRVALSIQSLEEAGAVSSDMRPEDLVTFSLTPRD